MMLFSGQPVWQKGTPQSMQRAPCDAERFFGKRVVNLEPIPDALGGRAAFGNFARVFEKAGDFTHGATSCSRRAGHGSARGFARQHALVFVGEDLDELGEHLLPAFQNPFGARALGELGVL